MAKPPHGLDKMQVVFRRLQVGPGALHSNNTQVLPPTAALSSFERELACNEEIRKSNRHKIIATEVGGQRGAPFAGEGG